MFGSRGSSGAGAPGLTLLDILQGPLVSLGLHLHVTLPGTGLASLGLRLAVRLSLGVRRQLGRIHGSLLPGAAPAVWLLLAAPLVHPIVPPHVLLWLWLLLLLAPVVLIVSLLSTRVPLLLLLLLTITLVLLVVARLEPLGLLLLLLAVVYLAVAGLRSLLASVGRVEVVGR